MQKTDLLIIGSGIAGLTAALKVSELSPNKEIIILTKGGENDSNTSYAQGGIAIVTDKIDSFEKHIQDTLRAGDGECNPKVVEQVVKEGPLRLREIINWGARFDEDDYGYFDLGKEGGHSENRVLHHKDITGSEILRALLKEVHKRKNIRLLSHYFVVDLITEHQILNVTTHVDSKLKCYGAYALNKKTGDIETFTSSKTIIATGGAGQVYQHTTNPKIATGDGIAMAYRAKAKVSDMQYVQFHPTALFESGVSPSFLISEAVRGAGAFLRNNDGERFMDKYDERGELASRDIVARSIEIEIQKNGGDFVYLDCSHLNTKEFEKHFPNIKAKCASIGIDTSTDMIPVVPATHYMCGGIEVDENGKTSMQNLYACGECAKTGLHGANRLASNSLLEALVYAHHIAIDVAPNLASNKVELPIWEMEDSADFVAQNTVQSIKKALQINMNENVGIIRNNKALQIGLKNISYHFGEVEHLYKKCLLDVNLCELRNLITTAYIIAVQSVSQPNNKGSYFNCDLLN